MKGDRPLTNRWHQKKDHENLLQTYSRKGLKSRAELSNTEVAGATGEKNESSFTIDFAKRKHNCKARPITQFEFGFAPESFNLFSETGIDGERVSREHREAAERRERFEAAQPSLLETERKTLRLASPWRLRAGDVVRYEGQSCRVLRVNDCAAVIEMEEPEREFTTRFGKTVRLKPKPRLVRIGSNSLVPILSRQNGGVL